MEMRLGLLKTTLLALVLLVVPAMTACGSGQAPAGEEAGTQEAQGEVPAAQGEAAAPPAAQADHDLPLHLLELPEGFEISVFSADVPGARSMTWSPEGILYVGTRQGADGRVYAVPDKNGDGVADRVYVIAEGLRMPNGVAWKDGDLYVAEVSTVHRFAGIDDKLADPPKPTVINDDYPTDRHHGWKFIAFGPDGWLYVPVGAPCNVCESEEIYSSITRIQPDGSNREIFAHGVRNTVGFDWHPETGVLWFTDNGRDWMGDDLPPDELNRAPEKGMHFGFPYCQGGDIVDPDLGSEGDCEKYVPPVQKLGPHVAALGMRFYTGESFPEEYTHQIFLAEHGSWNRTNKIGYRVMLVRLNGTEATSYEPFVTGWLQGEEAWGRPVDVHVMPDGALLVSDDKAGAIYRVQYTGGASPRE